MASIEDSGSFDNSLNLCGTKYFCIFSLKLSIHQFISETINDDVTPQAAAEQSAIQLSADMFCVLPSVPSTTTGVSFLCYQSTLFNDCKIKKYCYLFITWCNWKKKRLCHFLWLVVKRSFLLCVNNTHFECLIIIIIIIILRISMSALGVCFSRSPEIRCINWALACWTYFNGWAI